MEMSRIATGHNRSGVHIPLHRRAPGPLDPTIKVTSRPVSGKKALIEGGSE